jgi:septum formation protein
MKLILASASPRRRELLGKIGIDFEILPAKGEEIITKTLPWEVVEELSFQKAKEIAEQQCEECIVIGSDTIVAKGEKIMGKPKDEKNAFEMLSEIAGDVHQVYTGVTLIRTGSHQKVVTFAEKTDVFLYEMSESEILDYIASGDCLDKAGAYGIQDSGFVEKIDGSFSNVVGLPVELCKEKIAAFL